MRLYLYDNVYLEHDIVGFLDSTYKISSTILPISGIALHKISIWFTEFYRIKTIRYFIEDMNLIRLSTNARNGKK